jgi:hypothetical protein
MLEILRLKAERSDDIGDWFGFGDRNCLCNTSSMAGKSATPGYENEGRVDQDLVTNTQKERW